MNGQLFIEFVCCHIYGPVHLDLVNLVAIQVVEQSFDFIVDK